MVSRRPLWVALLSVGLVVGCGSSSGSDDGGGDVAPISPAPGTTPLPGGDPLQSGTAGGVAPMGPGLQDPAAPPPAQPVTDPLSPGGTDPAGPPTQPGDDPAAPPADPAAPPPPPATVAGPEDGDPSAPVVEVPGVPCGANPSLFGLTTTNTSIGGRDVHVAYPCGKRGGAPVTFILNLHGTMPDEGLKLYQVAYFSANNLADSHNFITVAPKSVVSQWGNGDGGVDRPHIMEVIDWVYTNFAEFDIRAMWVAGHSWGAMYSTTFVCDPVIADKIKGAVLQSGSGMNPACADRISVISTAAENDIGPVINQGTIPTLHGCGAAQTNMVGNNVETYWPDCNPGFVHANYLMLGKGHIDYIDAEVVTRIGDLINLARP